MDIEHIFQLVGVIAAIIVAVIVLGLSFNFGKRIYEQTSITLFDQSHSQEPTAHIVDSRTGPTSGVSWLASIATSAYDYRNVFWYVYTQLSVAVMIVTLLVILLIMNIIKPDAALPLIAAVGAYLLGRGIQPQSGNRGPESASRPATEGASEPDKQ